MTRFLRWVRVGLLDLYGDVRRFGILIACLALGTAAIAAVGFHSNSCGASNASARVKPGWPGAVLAHSSGFTGSIRAQ